VLAGSTEQVLTGSTEEDKHQNEANFFSIVMVRMSFGSEPLFRPDRRELGR